MQFKDVLKMLREERKLSQKEVALSCDISPTCICQLETGQRNPTGTTLYSLADFFQVSTDYLLGRSDDLGVISISSHKNPMSDMTSDSKELLDIYNSLDKMHRVQVLEYARYFATRVSSKKNKQR